MTQPTRVFDLLQILSERYPNKTDILSYRAKDGWVYYSVRDYVNYSKYISFGLLSKGFKKGDKIIVISSNRPEWNFLEMGCAMAGIIFISIYSTLNDDEMKYICDHSEASMICFGDQHLSKKIKPITDSLDKKVEYCSFDPIENMESIWDIIEYGKQNEKQYSKVISDNVDNISKDDIETILYTSGTTGIPKGVLLSHWNLMSNSHAHTLCMPIDHNSKMLSALPLSHIYERSMNYDYQELGISIYYCESVNTIARDLAECHANGFCAVPRILEKLYSAFESSGKSLKGASRQIFNMAWEFGNRHDYYSNGFIYNLKYKFFDKMVYQKWRNYLGGNPLTIVCGGSAVQMKILRLFCAAKMVIHEGYGLSETSPVIAVNNPNIGVNIFGTVGKPLKGTELKIAEDGEILTRGPHVMKGYYKDPEQTKEVIDSEGWFHTGDIGFLVDGLYLKITDRKKEIFKTTSGKYIAPQMIESKIKENSLFVNCIVFGAGQKYASAIIVPCIERLKAIAEENNIGYIEANDLLNNPTIIKILNRYIQEINKKLAPFEQIKRQRYVLDEWSTANGMLSQTLKLKRNSITNRYSDIIEDIYKL